jgi:hypothetical protein
MNQKLYDLINQTRTVTPEQRDELNIIAHELMEMLNYHFWLKTPQTLSTITRSDLPWPVAKDHFDQLARGVEPARVEASLDAACLAVAGHPRELLLCLLIRVVLRAFIRRQSVELTTILIDVLLGEGHGHENLDAHLISADRTAALVEDIG